MPTLTPSSQHIIGSLSHNNQRRKRNKKFKTKRDKVKLSLYTVDMILCVQPEGSTQMLLELIKEFSKVAEYKINIQKPIAFIHTNNKISERDNHWILRPGPGQGSELNCPCPCSLPSDFLESRSSLLWLYPTVFSLGLFFFFPLWVVCTDYSYFWKFLLLHLATNFESFPKGGLLYIQG